MNYLVVALALAAMPTVGSGATHAAADCSVRILQPVTDDLGNHWETGKILSVTIERDGKDGGSFCAHGGSCVPRKVNQSEAVKLLHCRIGPKIDATDHKLVPR
jgi:hypothetical protein